MQPSPYHFSTEPSGTHALLIGEVPPNSRVLDVGCASGYLGRYLKEHKQCEVWAIEPHPDAAKEASEHYVKVFVSSIEEAIQNPALMTERFDVIILGDVLEHLVSPEIVFEKLQHFLKPGGRFVVSLPNVGHYSTRLGLLFGHWDMQDTGILDRTHLHFYTKATAMTLLCRPGMTLEKVMPRGDLERWFRKIGLEPVGKFLAEPLATWFAVQFVFVLKRA